MAGSQRFALQTVRLIADIWRRYGWSLAALILLMTAVAVTEGIGMALLLPLLASIGLARPGEGFAFGDTLMSALRVSGSGSSPYALPTALLAVLALQLALFVLQQWWVSWLQRDYGAFWQRRLFDAFIRAEWSFLAEQKVGNVTNLIAQEALRLSAAFLILVQSAAMVLATLVYLVIGLAIGWQVTALIVGFAVVLFVALQRIGRRSFQIGQRLGPLAAELQVLLTEFLGGVKLLKATATEDQASERVTRVIDQSRVEHTWATFLPSVARAVMEFSALAALCLMLVFGRQTLGIPAASLLVIFALFVRLLPRLNALHQNVHLFATYLPAFDIVSRMLDSAAAAAERRTVATRAMLRPTAISGPLTISLSRAGYRGHTILKGVNLTLPERGLVGIVGESGAGKSTLVNCLLGLADVDEGTVAFGTGLMNDIPLGDWRRQFGYVPQETVLFHLTIRDNIAWGMPTATDAEIVRAAEQALAHDFILEQPQGYLTLVGDHGAKLSGGQRQRLSIARALLSKPRLLILDEATNALDLASEALVLETIHQLRRDMCVLMIAHRLAVVRSADVIVVLENGHVAESGSWNELIAQRGALSRLAAVTS